MSGNLFDSLVPDISRAMLDEVLENNDSRALAAMNLHAEYYRNDLKPDKPQEMSDDTYKDRLDAWIGVPLASMLVNTISAGLYNRDVDRTSGSDVFDKALEPIWQSMPNTMLQNARLASTVGDSVVRIMPDWQRGVRLVVWDGRHVVPLYNPEDPQEIIGLIYDYLADPISSQMARLRGGNGPVQDRIEIITKHIRNKTTGEIVLPGIRAKFIDDVRVPWSLENPEHDAYNPCGDYLDGVFWRNAIDPFSARGMSDLSHLVPMLRGINESTTDARLLLEWFIYPIIWIDGEMDEQPPYSHKAVWQLPTRANGQASQAGMLEWSQKLDGFRTHYEHLLGLIHECARTPAVATGDLSHIGELSSGRAYEIAMRPYLDMLQERERICEVQELELMRAMIALLAYQNKAPFTGLTSPMGYGFPQPDPLKIDKATEDADIAFSPLRLAEDANMTAQTHSTRIGAGYESTETAIRETHPDWPDDRVAEELERVGGGKAAETDAAADLRIAQQQAAIADAAAAKKQPE